MPLPAVPFDETPPCAKLTRRRLLAALLALGLLPVAGLPARLTIADTAPVTSHGWLLAPGDR